jgi:DNA-binding IclR family transcriptional regulator
MARGANRQIVSVDWLEQPGVAMTSEEMMSRQTQRPRRFDPTIEDPEKGNGAVKSAFRVFEILEYFDDVQREAQVVEISNALKYPQSSTSALLRSMVKLGYLRHDRYKRTYISSPRVALLGHWVSPDIFREGPLIELMKSITAETGDGTILAMRRGFFSQYAHVVQATSPARLQLSVGSLRPIAACGTGLTLMSAMNDTDIMLMMRRINGEATGPGQKVNVAEAMAVIRKVRKQGYAMCLNMVTPGGGSIATLLPRMSGDLPAVIAIGGISEVLARHEKELAALLLDRVAQFSGKNASAEVRRISGS